MSITNGTPIVVPDVPSRTFDRWFIAEYHRTTPPGATSPVSVTARLVPALVDKGLVVVGQDTGFTLSLGDVGTLSVQEDSAVGGVLDQIATIRQGAPTNWQALSALMEQSLGVVGKLRGLIP